MQVIKRDGRVMEFNRERIVDAITKSMAQTPGGIDIELANKIALSVEKQLEDLLTNNKIPYEKNDEVWDNDEKIYHNYYEI